MITIKSKLSAITLMVVLALLTPVPAQAQTIPLTTISDVLLDSSGALFNGTLHIRYPYHTDALGNSYNPGEYTTQVFAGILLVRLPSSNNPGPFGTYQYEVFGRNTNGNVYSKFWNVVYSAVIVTVSSLLDNSSGGGGGGGGGASATYQLTDFTVVRTSPTVLTVGAGCAPLTPCPVKFGDQTYLVNSSTTVTLNSGNGTGFISLDNTQTYNVGIPASGMSVSCSSCSSGTGTAFPFGQVPLYTWTANSGSWDALGGISYRAFIGTGKRILSGTGCQTFGETSTTLTVNCAGLASYTPRYWPVAQDAPTGGGCQYGTGYVFPSGNDFPHHTATIGPSDNCTIAMASTGSTMIYTHWWDGTTPLTMYVIWVEDTATVALAQWGLSVACPASQNSATYSTPVTATGTPTSIGQFMTTPITPSMGSCTGAGMIYLKLTNSAAGSGTTYTHNLDLVGTAI